MRKCWALKSRAMASRYMSCSCAKKSHILVLKNHLHHAVPPRANGLESLLALGQGKGLGDQALRLKFRDHTPRQIDAARLVPPPGQGGVQCAHLAGNDAHAVAMETPAQIQQLRLGS